MTGLKIKGKSRNSRSLTQEAKDIISSRRKIKHHEFVLKNIGVHDKGAIPGEWDAEISARKNLIKQEKLKIAKLQNSGKSDKNVFVSDNFKKVRNGHDSTYKYKVKFSGTQNSSKFMSLSNSQLKKIQKIMEAD